MGPPAREAGGRESGGAAPLFKLISQPPQRWGGGPVDSVMRCDSARTFVLSLKFRASSQWRSTRDLGPAAVFRARTSSPGRRPGVSFHSGGRRRESGHPRAEPGARDANGGRAGIPCRDAAELGDLTVRESRSAACGALAWPRASRRNSIFC
ncbi:hypothetical protein PLANPX_2260 [Lacipirellula parvula]|uniref:Uncharacterized protein n=1 Tax=Lacipirellula parvula TaxID=2650471 RepID=A0A5K7X7V7_9BACT|nr:hypothetical protein PLANPX_2260 [Lacipirellula parvula]